MRPTAEELERVSGLRQGSLNEVPFALLLRALAEARRTVVVEIRRKQLNKSIILEDGVPIDCQSNLVHERLGRFMVGLGRLSESQFSSTFSESIKREVPLGEVLIQEGLVTASELYRILQQNLAKKLLDGFSWSDGDFRVHGELPEVASALKVRVHQLILTGLLRFAPQQDIDLTVMTLIGKKLGRHPYPPVAMKQLRFTSGQQKLLEALDQPCSLSDLVTRSGLGNDEVSRMVYALGMLGLLGTEDEIELARRNPPVVLQPTPAKTVPTMTAAERFSAEEVMAIYLTHRRVDAYDLLKLEETASTEEISDTYVQLAQRLVPSQYSDDDALRERVQELFLAAARAYAELADSESRGALLFKRKTLREDRERERQVGPQRIATDLLDPEAQYKKGCGLVAEGKHGEALQYLDFASDCDPQNGLYRSEAAFCRYVASPSDWAKALDELAEARRIDPSCGLAFFYAGEIHRDRGDYDKAEPLLKASIKPLAPDRRPLDALREMVSQRKKK